MVMAPEFFTFSCFSLSSFGSFMFMAVDWAMVVVNTKKVSNRKPRSTIGVRSTRVESFFPFLTPGPFLCPPPDEVSISAIIILFYSFKNLYLFLAAGLIQFRSYGHLFSFCNDPELEYFVGFKSFLDILK